MINIDKLNKLNIINDELKSIYEFDEYTLIEILNKFYDVLIDYDERLTNLEVGQNE